MPTGLPLGGQINAAIPHVDAECVERPALALATLETQVVFRNRSTPKLRCLCASSSCWRSTIPYRSVRCFNRLPRSGRTPRLLIAYTIIYRKTAIGYLTDFDRIQSIYE